MNSQLQAAKGSRLPDAYRTLQTISLIYISTPAIIFILGWLKIYFAVPIAAMILAGLYSSIKAGRDSEPERPQTESYVTGENITDAGPSSESREKPAISSLNIIMIVGIVILIVVCAGVGGYVNVRDRDYMKHDAFYKDLMEYSWPPAYKQTGTDNMPRMLNTYVGYYLPAAFAGKLFGWNAMNFVSFVWACLGVLLAVFWFLQFLKKPSFLYSLVFLFFGALDTFGWLGYIGKPSFGIDYEYHLWMALFACKIDYPNMHGLFWIFSLNNSILTQGPHHIMTSWICTFMLFHDAVYRRSCDRALFLFSAIPFTSVFATIGVVPFVVLSLFQKRIKRIFSFQNFVSAPLMLVVAGLYLTSNNLTFEKGWIWSFADMTTILPHLIFSYMVGFALYLAVMPQKRQGLLKDQRIWLYVAVAIFLLFPFYRIGKYMDFPNKGFIPAMIIFQIFIANSIGGAESRLDKLRSALMILLLFIGSFAALSNITRAIRSGVSLTPYDENKVIHINELQPRAQSIQLFSDGNSFFWKHLAKTPIYY